MAIVYLSTPARTEICARVFEAAGVRAWYALEDVTAPEEVRVICTFAVPQDLSRFPNLEVVVSGGAGVDQFRDLPEGVALCRMIAPGIAPMVRDWCVMAALMLHRDMPLYRERQGRGEWLGSDPVLARRRRVGILGMGRIGQEVARTLSQMGFPVSGWSRSGRAVPGGTAYGAAQLPEFLAGCDLLIGLLPLTPETRGMFDAGFLAQLPMGARFVQAGRGAQLDMEALRGALETGQLSSAALDVTNPEPLPSDHWAWSDPRVVITPHVASNTDAEESAEHVLEVLRAVQAGAALPGLVDRSRGY